jgi:hypothetical protein
MCAHQSPHLDQRLILTNEANPKTKTTLQVENTNKLYLDFLRRSNIHLYNNKLYNMLNMCLTICFSLGLPFLSLKVKKLIKN